MRYIDKSNRCEVWDNYIREVSPVRWSAASKHKKLLLHQHVHEQQNGLCIYCEQEVPKKNSIDNKYVMHPTHLEHIVPKGRYPDSEFEQSNIAVSCLGFTKGKYSMLSDGRVERTACIHPEFCGHWKDYTGKDAQFDQLQFLHPHEQINIGNHFWFDVNGKIHGYNFNANYMIQLLQLNHPDLEKIRSETYQFLAEKEIFESFDIISYLDSIPEFYTMIAKLFGILKN